MTRVDVGATFFDSSISDSPLTDDDTALSATLVYTRMF
jgi:outer membrane protein